MFKKFILPAVFVVGSALAAQAASVSAIFNDQPFREGVSADVNTIIDVTIVDTASSVNIVISGLSPDFGVGSIWLKDLVSPSDVSGPGAPFVPLPTNIYADEFGSIGLVLPGRSGSTFAGETDTYVLSASLGLTASSFAGGTIAMIAATATSPNLLAGGYVGSFGQVVPMAAVPLPAGLPLIVLGLGALGVAGRRARRTA